MLFLPKDEFDKLLDDLEQHQIQDLERRKAIKEDPCESCDSSGLIDRVLCSDCLGQGVVLTSEEYEWLRTFAARADDEILSQQEFE